MSACMRPVFQSIMRLLVLVGALLSIAASASAETTARVVETDPAGASITLARNESLYVRIAYASEATVSIWARPFFRGTEVPAKSNASVPHTGNGEALGWFEPMQPGRIDEIRVLAGDGSRGGTRVVSTYRIDVTTTSEPAPPRARAEWVETLSREEEAVRREAYERRMREPVTAKDSVFMSGFMLAVLGLLFGGVAWPAWGVWKWHGGWRLAAALPIAAMSVVVLRILIDTARDPTSHNLWPFEIIMWGGGSCLFMVALKFVRRIANA
jgi:hypothetical protein